MTLSQRRILVLKVFSPCVWAIIISLMQSLRADNRDNDKKTPTLGETKFTGNVNILSWIRECACVVCGLDVLMMI